MSRTPTVVSSRTYLHIYVWNPLLRRYVAARSVNPGRTATSTVPVSLNLSTANATTTARNLVKSKHSIVSGLNHKRAYKPHKYHRQAWNPRRSHYTYARRTYSARHLLYVCQTGILGSIFTIHMPDILGTILLRTLNTTPSLAIDFASEFQSNSGLNYHNLLVNHIQHCHGIVLPKLWMNS